jgi:hypothetical protein
MKFLILILPALLLTACVNDTKNEQSELEDKLDEMKDQAEQGDLDSAMDDFKVEFDRIMAESDSILDALKRDFAAYDGVERRVRDVDLVLEKYDWENRIEFLYPAEPIFRMVEKADHDTYTTMSVVEGVIYTVKISDYAELGADKIDAGFTNYQHEKYIQYLDGESQDGYELKTEEGMSGFASAFIYSMDDNTYYSDMVTYSYSDLMIQFTITSKVSFENKLRVQDFMDGFAVK